MNSTTDQAEWIEHYKNGFLVRNPHTPLYVIEIIQQLATKKHNVLNAFMHHLPVQFRYLDSEISSMYVEIESDQDHEKLNKLRSWFLYERSLVEATRSMHQARVQFIHAINRDECPEGIKDALVKSIFNT